MKYNVSDLGLIKGNILYDFVLTVSGGAILKKYIVQDILLNNSISAIDSSTQEWCNLHYSYIVERCAKNRVEAVEKQIELLQERIETAKSWKRYYEIEEANKNEEIQKK